MGCASSTPMIATAGSDMLKAATHAASDAAKSAENAVEDVTESVGKTLESAKETVGTAVTGIAHELGNVFTEKSAELDTAKNQLLEKLHLGGATKALEHTSEATANQLDTAALEAVARAPTPPPDLDSLKTSTPEPEIERAMANSHEDTPPTPKPTFAELEKLTAEVKQTAQTTAVTALTATAVTDGVAEVKHAPAEASTGTTAANEPAVDMIAWLVAEKRPGTTEWEKHADHLSKTRKMNAFKGGGKFRRFGPPAAPPKFMKSTENINIKRTLLEDDSCNSDPYYNSHSSPTNSDSPMLRRARLPKNSVLATNAKRMQRELATFVSNRRSTASALRSLTVSPALGRRFDYNLQRARITSPTPSLIACTRSGYGTTAVADPELLLNPHTSNWQKGGASVRLTSPVPNVGRAPRAIAARTDSPLASNVITQSKLKSTKAFAPLRGKTTGRPRIFGQTRSSSPVNRRVFAKRSVSPRTEKAPSLLNRSRSPERTRALMQGKVEGSRRRQPVAQTPTIIKLERQASIKERKHSGTAEVTANAFSLSKALSPIKMAAETHSLPHLKSAEHKPATTITHAMVKVVEQAVERDKRGGLSKKMDVKVVENMQRETTPQILENSVKGKETPYKKVEKKSYKKQNDERKNDNSHKNIKYEKPQARTENNAAGSDTSSSHSKNRIPSPMKQNSKCRSTAERKNAEASEIQQSASPDYNINNSELTNFVVNGRYSMSPNKREKLTYQNNNSHPNNLVESSPGHRWQPSSHNLSREASFNIELDNQKILRSSSNSSPSPRQRDKLKSKHSKNELLNNSHVGAKRTYLHQAKQTNNNNENNRNRSSVFQNNWTSSSRRNSNGEHTNITKQFESHAGPGFIGKEGSSSPMSRRLQSTHHKKVDNTAMFSERDLSNHSTSNASAQHNQTHTNNWHSSNISEQISINNSRALSQTERIRNRGQGKMVISAKNYEKNNNEYKLKCTKNSDSIQTNNHFENESEENNHIINGRRGAKLNTSTHLPTTTSSTKDARNTTSPNHNSPNSSPSKSSKSSTSIVIGTHLSTPDTEDDNEVASSVDVTKALQSLEQLNEAKHDENSVHTSCSGDENSQNDQEDSLRTEHEDSSRTDYEETIHTDTGTELSSRTALDISSSSSLDDLISRLSPQTAYLNLGRSATMMTLRPTTPIFYAAPSSFRSTPHGSPCRQKHYTSCGSDQLEKVLFVAELSSVARSRSPQVPASPYTMRARCAVCHDKYVIK